MDEVQSEQEDEEDACSSSSSSSKDQCRICLEYGGEELIAPCRCKGTQKYVHRACLDNWRSVKEGFAFSHCTECRAVFCMRVNSSANSWWPKLKFQLLVFRDHVAIFLLVQTVVSLLGVMVYGIYGEELKEMFGYDEHPVTFYSLAVLVLLLVGLLYAFFIAIICGQRISNRHYHILRKQDRTKEYVVEGLNDDEEQQLQIEEVELQMLGSELEHHHHHHYHQEEAQQPQTLQ